LQVVLLEVVRVVPLAEVLVDLGVKLFLVLLEAIQ
jgi:hypothetical protein